MLREFGVEEPISWAKPAHFGFFAINFTVWSHILSIGGDALNKWKNPLSMLLCQENHNLQFWLLLWGLSSYGFLKLFSIAPHFITHPLPKILQL
jgi:hypothetical protein